MSGRQNTFVHPYTFFLVDLLKEVMEDFDQKQFSEVIDDLYWFICILDTDLQNDLEKEEQEIEKLYEQSTQFYGIDMTDQIQARSALQTLQSRRQVRRIFKKIMQLLHKEGYFREARKGLQFPSGKRESGEGTYPGAPKLMSSEIK